MSAAGSYKNYNYVALSQQQVDAFDSTLPMTEPHHVSRILDQSIAIGGQLVSVTLTPSQMRQLHATPVTIVAAPGAGLALILQKVVVKMTYNSVAYDAVGASDDLTLKYTDASGTILTQIETVGFLDQASSQVRVGCLSTGAVARLELTPIANAPIVANILTGEIAAANLDANGNSSVRFDCYYSVVAV